MPEIFEIKARIDGLKSIHNITYAMQIVTISRLKRITTQLQRLKDSQIDVQRMLGKFLAEDERFNKTFFAKTIDPEKKPLYVLFFSNRGFCGSFNQDIYNTFLQDCQASQLSPGAVDVIGIGKKASVILKDPTAKFFAPEKDLFTVQETQAPLALISSYVNGGHPVRFVFFRFKSIISQKIVIEQLFPFEPSSFTEYMTRTKPIFVEPSLPEAEKDMLEIFLRILLLRSIQDSASSEFSQRFLLMKSAVDSVKSLLDELHLQLNKERQRMITQEILEIISTFNVLQKK